jgi:hypothetical protein
MKGGSGRRGGLLAVLVAAVVSNWSSLTSAITTSIIRSDLADYARTVRRSALPLPDKPRLLDHLDALDARFRSSPLVSLSRTPGGWAERAVVRVSTR